MKNITIAGAGAGNPSDMTVRTRQLLREAGLVIGASRLVEGAYGLCCEEEQTEFCKEYIPERIAERLKQSEKESVVILMSGDSGFYSGTKKLLDVLEREGYQAEVEPGISSLSYFASRLQISWEDARIISLHGNTANLAGALRKSRKVFALTQGQTGEVCRRLTEAGYGDVKLYVGRNLSYPQEEIIETTPAEYREDKEETLSVLLLIRDRERREPLVGIPDDAFLRGKVPMTKSEVRAVILSKLMPGEEDILYDIGAGTGSVSVELAMAADRGRVYAIECKEEAAELIEENKQRFGCDNIEIIRGTAPEALEGLPMPDGVFIGGTRGRLLSVLEAVLHPGHPIRIVVSAVTLETVSSVFADFEQLGIRLCDACQTAVTRLERVGNYHMMKAQNPVFIITGEYDGGGHGVKTV